MSVHLRELEAACLAARAAGAVILRHYAGGAIAVDTKADASPVTAADRDANAVIVAHLAAAFPDDGLLSEESPDDARRLDKRRVWIIDPLDGTRDFVARTDDFCVHVALAIDGAPAVGVVFHPVSGSLFAGVTGGGAFVENDGQRRPLRVSTVTDRTALRVGVSRTNATDLLKRCLAETGLGRRAVIMGASIKLMAVARGDLDAVVNFSFTEGEWDTCAPEAVLREAGGTLTDVEGRAFVYNQPTAIHRAGSIASNTACHDGVVALVHPYVPHPGTPS